MTLVGVVLGGSKGMVSTGDDAFTASGPRGGGGGGGEDVGLGGRGGAVGGGWVERRGIRAGGSS